MNKSFKRITIALVLVLTISTINSVSGQTQKGSWMIGGSAGFMSNSNKYSYQSNNTSGYKNNSFNINANTGYFIKDHFAIGLNSNINFWNNEEKYASNIKSNGSNIGLGIFGRYYFLEKSGNMNFIGELGYGFDKASGNDQSTKNTSVKFGPVLFLNKNTALEILFKYNSSVTNFSSAKETNNNTSINIGFQIHL